MKRSAMFLLACICWVPLFLRAQSTTGSIEGWMLDTDGRPIPYANIRVTSSDLQGSRGTASDERGYFQLSSLPIGTYSAKISHVSYHDVVLENIVVSLGRTTSLGEIRLEQGTVTMNEVVVTVGNQAIDTRSAADVKNLSATEFSQLPIERNYFQIAQLLPNANISYKNDGGTNFAGATGIENRYFIDGAEVTGTEEGILRFDLPYNFIRQVEVQTAGYQSEYQSALGGMVNTITYSGGNEFHGSVFGFYTNNDFSKAPRLSEGQPPKGSYTNYDVGFGFGGPLERDRLWYYIAYDPEVSSEEVFVDGLGNQPSEQTRHRFAGKLTWSLDEKNVLTLALTGSPYNGRSIINRFPGFEFTSPGACNRDVSSFIGNGSVTGIHRLSDHVFLESTLSANHVKTKVTPGTPEGIEPTFLDWVTMRVSGGQGYTEMHPAESRYHADVKGTVTLMSHILKAGIGYTRNSATRDVLWRFMMRYPDATYSVTDQSTVGTVESDNFLAFVQDSWQISERLCLNVGVRWDPQWLIASDGTLAQKIIDQVQPRIGIVYQPAELGTQKITASYGRFYEPLLLSLSVYYHIKGVSLIETYYPNDPRVDTSGAVHSRSNFGFVTNVPDVKGQYFDEFSLGYERRLSSDVKLGIRGMYRRLGQGIEDGVVSEADQEAYGSLQVYGNPGSGMLSMLPRMKREYTALEVTLQRFAPRGINVLVSYVLSQNRGNYDGFAETYDVTGGADIFPNNTNQFGTPSRMMNADGLLPNDRTHVFKLFGSYAFDFGLTTGIAVQWMSGTPLNEFGKIPEFNAASFLQPRGTVGRTPSIWDLSFRVKYDLSHLIPLGVHPAIILDVLHVSSQRTAIDYDQYRYYDYAQVYPNPNYMTPVQFQPPMSMRLGMEVNF